MSRLTCVLKSRPCEHFLSSSRGAAAKGLGMLFKTGLSVMIELTDCIVRRAVITRLALPGCGATKRAHGRARA